MMLFEALTGTVALTCAAAAQVEPCSGWSIKPYASPPMLVYVDMTYDSARGSLVLFGADAFSPPLTLEWQGDVWAIRAVSGPTARRGHALAYDAARGETILFGGAQVAAPNTVFGDTWSWNGAEWLLLSESGPTPRQEHAMAYDAKREVVVLFGGRPAGTSPFGDTWAWDGASWKQVATSGPSPRRFSTMTFDARRGVVVLFGGVGSTTYRGDTWEWDGVAWTQRADTGPSPRAGHGMSFDVEHGVTVLFGGDAGSQYKSDTWVWDGAVWSEVGLPGPEPRAYTGMAFDAARGVTATAAGKAWQFTYVKDMWTFRPGPGLSNQIASQPIFVNTATKLSIAPISPEPLTFQWRRDGAPLVNGGNVQGADTGTLVLDPVLCEDAGVYDVLLTNACGQNASDPATLTTKLRGDLTMDGLVDQADLGVFLTSYGSCQGQAGWLPAADFDGDGCVDQNDLGVLLAEYGSACP